MKKLDLNIKLDAPAIGEDGTTELTPVDVAISWISRLVERAINKPQFNPRTSQWNPTASPTMAVQRKYGKLMDKLENNKGGIVELEDEDFSFLQSKWNQAGVPAQRDINKILLQLDKVLACANIGKES